MSWSVRLMFCLLATIPVGAHAQRPIPVTGRPYARPPVVIPYTPTNTRISVQIVGPSPSLESIGAVQAPSATAASPSADNATASDTTVWDTASESTTSPAETEGQAESWSVNVEVVPPPEPPDEPLPGDECHDDGNVSDGIDECEEDLAVREPTGRRLSWWQILLGLAVGAILLNWISNLRRH